MARSAAIRSKLLRVAVFFPVIIITKPPSYVERSYILPLSFIFYWTSNLLETDSDISLIFTLILRGEKFEIWPYLSSPAIAFESPSFGNETT